MNVLNSNNINLQNNYDKLQTEFNDLENNYKNLEKEKEFLSIEHELLQNEIEYNQLVNRNTIYNSLINVIRTMDYENDIYSQISNIYKYVVYSLIFLIVLCIISLIYKYHTPLYEIGKKFFN